MAGTEYRFGSGGKKAAEEVSDQSPNPGNDPA